LNLPSQLSQRSPCLDRAGLGRGREKAPLQKRGETWSGELYNFTIPCETKIKPFGNIFL